MNNQTETFLDLLLGGSLEPATFQTFDDSKGKDKTLARVVHGSIEDVHAELSELSKRGAGVFVTVNETDLRGRRKENVTAVRAVFVDADDTPMRDFALEPSIIVERDATHWHAYWLVDDCELSDFTNSQEQLAEYYDTDRAVKDLPRVMRVAGFDHKKTNENIGVNVIHESGRRYSLAQILLAHPVEMPKKKPVAILSGMVPNGQRHSFLVQTAGQLRSLGLNEKEIYGALQGVRDTRFETPSETPDDNLIEIAGWASTKDTGLTIADIERGKRSADAINKFFEKQNKVLNKKTKKGVGEIPNELLSGLGVIKVITDWINDCSYKPQPELDFMATICALGTLYGRKVKTSSGARTNIYGMGIGETGCGKDNARQCIKKMFYSVSELSDLIGAESLASDAGLVSCVAETPSVLIQWDEFGRALKCLNNPERNPIQYAIITEFMKLYTSAGTTFKGKAYRDSKNNVTINYPNLCIYGTSTPQAFHDSLNREAIVDGFLGRLLVMWSSRGTPRSRKNVKELPVPMQIKTHLKEWAGANTESMTGDAKIIKRTERAQQLLDDFFDDIYDREQRDKKKHGELAHMWGRAGQQADQISLVYACAKHSRAAAIIDEECMKAAIAFIIFMTEKRIEKLGEEITENDTEKRVLELLKKIKAANGITRSQLYKKTRHLSKAQREDALDNLIESGDVKIDLRETGGRSQTVYVCA